MRKEAVVVQAPTMAKIAYSNGWKTTALCMAYVLGHEKFPADRDLFRIVDVRAHALFLLIALSEFVEKHAMLFTPHLGFEDCVDASVSGTVN